MNKRKPNTNMRLNLSGFDSLFLSEEQVLNKKYEDYKERLKQIAKEIVDLEKEREFIFVLKGQIKLKMEKKNENRKI